jgi:hypothetical protein
MNHAELIARIKAEAKMWLKNIEALEATGCDEIELETADHERLIKILKEAAKEIEILVAEREAYASIAAAERERVAAIKQPRLSPEEIADLAEAIMSQPIPQILTGKLYPTHKGTTS